MIYIKTKDDRHLLILEPANLKALQEGRPAKSPDGHVTLAFSPDIVWTGQMISANASLLNSEVLDAILKEGLSREEKATAEPHETVQIIRDGDRVDRRQS